MNNASFELYSLHALIIELNYHIHNLDRSFRMVNTHLINQNPLKVTFTSPYCSKNNQTLFIISTMSRKERFQKN